VRRADRLFRIVQFLRRGRLLTARKLSEKLQVSQRTIYRDVRDLQLSGMPIEGEAGVGYTLRQDLDLPPLTFTAHELTALVLGARLVQAWGGANNVSAANDALMRIEAVLPVELRERLDTILLYAPGVRMKKAMRERLDLLHEACVARRVAGFDYVREDGAASRRTVRPLGLYFFSGVWTLASWCELRDDFRVFRIDRMEEVRIHPRTFAPKKGQRLEDFVRKVKGESSVEAKVVQGSAIYG